MKRYIHSLLAEYWKFGRTWAVAIWLITPALLLIGHFMAIYLDEGAGYQRYTAMFGHESPWHYLYQSYAYIQGIIWPLLSITLTVSLISQEYKSDMWRSCPVAIHRQLWSKWGFLAVLIAVGLFIGWLIAAVGIYSLSLTLNLPFDDFQADGAYMAIRFLQLYPILLCVASLHFWLSLHSRAHLLLNIALPLVAIPLGNYTPYGLLFGWWRLHSQYLDLAIAEEWAAWASYSPILPSVSGLALFLLCLLHIIGYLTFKHKQSWILSQ